MPGLFNSTQSCVGCRQPHTKAAGRQPNPVNLVQHSDEIAGCQQIMAEIKANNETTGLFIPVLWFGMDFQDAAGKEGKALSQRNEYLAGLAKKRC